MLYDLTPTQGLCELLRIARDYQQILGIDATTTATEDLITHELWCDYEDLLSAIWIITYQLFDEMR